MILDQNGKPFPIPQSVAQLAFSAAVDKVVLSVARESIERCFQLPRIVSPIVDNCGLPIYSSVQKIGYTYEAKIPVRFRAQ